MINYLIYSTICMGLILLFYHLLLAKEKTYQINRWYLLAGLIFSLIIPLMPLGVSYSFLGSSVNTEIPQVLSKEIENLHPDSIPQFSPHIAEQSSAKQSPVYGWGYQLLLSFYIIVTLTLSFRLIHHLYRLQLKSMENPVTYFKDHKVVLVGDETGPYTFWKTIFLNKEQYQNKEISKQMLTHEMVHAKQNHTLDILITEVFKTIFWFNPVLYFYKKAIRLNHEYIADEKVISTGTNIANYQSSLLRIRKAKSAQYLSNNLNFNITKKRFEMMTKNNSEYRSSLKTTLIIPFFVILSITFGCDRANMQKGDQTEFIKLELVNSQTIKLNGKTIPKSKFNGAFSELSVDPDHTVIDLNVHQNVPVGIVTDIQEVLRDNGTLKINYSKEQSNKASSTKLDSRNILDIHINKTGNIIANQEVASLSSLKGLVKKFITNNGKSAGLSESPKNAVIAIKTDQRTPHDTYKNAIENITDAYDELRNKSSMALFDKPYSTLEKGSAERDKIKNIYPKRISIKDPS